RIAVFNCREDGCNFVHGRREMPLSYKGGTRSRIVDSRSSSNETEWGLRSRSTYPSPGEGLNLANSARRDRFRGFGCHRPLIEFMPNQIELSPTPASVGETLASGLLNIQHRVHGPTE